jgi:hypothetical protein
MIMNGIGDIVTSLKETHRLAEQILISLKGDGPGHPFRGNQYEGGGGGGSSGEESSGSGSSGSSGTKAPPPPKVSASHELVDQFTTKKGDSIYSLQKPVNGEDRGWRIGIHTRVSNRAYSSFGKPVHMMHMQGNKDEVQREFSDMRKYH